MEQLQKKPLGLGVALLENREAFRSFVGLSIPEQQNFVENAHSVTSAAGMRAYVGTLVLREGGEKHE